MDGGNRNYLTGTSQPQQPCLAVEAASLSSMHGSFPCLPCGYVLTCKPTDVIPFSGRPAIPKLAADASWLLEVCLAALPAAGPCWHRYRNMSKHCEVHLSQLSSWGLSISDWRNPWEGQARLFIRLRNRDGFLHYEALCSSGKPEVRILAAVKALTDGGGAATSPEWSRTRPAGTVGLLDYWLGGWRDDLGGLFHP